MAVTMCGVNVVCKFSVGYGARKEGIEENALTVTFSNRIEVQDWVLLVFTVEEDRFTVV